MEQKKQQYEFVGNNLGIDFINTEINVRGELVDLLSAGSDVMAWLKQAGIHAVFTRGDVDLQALLAFRSQAREMFTRIIDNKDLDKGTLSSFNAFLADYQPHYRLEKSADGYQLISQHVCHSTAGLIGLLAFELSRLLAGDQLKYLKRCLNPDCVLMFVDNSRSHKRRWCSMDTCGNRAKVSKHYRKTKS